MIGPFHVYGVVVGLGAILSVAVSQLFAQAFGVDKRRLESVVPYILVAGILGARAYHVMTDYELYRQASVMDLVSIWNGGIGFFGAVLGVMVGLFVWIIQSFRTQRVWKFFQMLDLFAIGVPLGHAIGRVGNFVNQELYGTVTTLPWGIWIDGVKVHPLFAYELIGNLVIFFLLLAAAKRRWFVPGKGQYACLYLGLYSTLRWWLELLRPVSARMTGVFSVMTTAQWVCLVLLLCATGLFWLRRHAPKKSLDWSLE